MQAVKQRYRAFRKWMYRHRWTILSCWIVIFSVAHALEQRDNRHLTAENHRLAKEGVNAHIALCVFKVDLGRRADVGAQFLKDHPHGIPGIPASTLTTSVNNQRATYRSLQVLKCDELKGE